MTQCGWGAKGKDNRTAARSLINIKKQKHITRRSIRGVKRRGPSQLR